MYNAEVYTTFKQEKYSKFSEIFFKVLHHFLAFLPKNSVDIKKSNRFKKKSFFFFSKQFLRFKPFSFKIKILCCYTKFNISNFLAKF